MAVWGDWHVRTFLEINLPTLLAPNNFPAFVKLLPTRFLIYTTPRDRDRMQRARLFRELTQLLDVHFVELQEKDIRVPIYTHNLVWDNGRVEALKTRSMAMVMPPDVAWSDGSLGHMANLVIQGKSALFLNWHLRAVAETFIPQFMDLYFEQDRPISLSGRDLVRLTFENIHPLCCAYLRDSAWFPYHSEMVFYPVSGQGLLMHVFSLIPFLFDPMQFQLTENKSIIDIGDPSRLHCVSDSDDLFMTSLASIGKDNVWYQRNGKLDPVLFAKWWLYYDSPSNDFLVTQQFRLHYGEINEPDWRRAGLGARQLIRRLMSSRDLYRIYLAARRLECKRASQLVAAAMHARIGPLLARELVPMTVFIPQDAAFGEPWEMTTDFLLHPDNRRLFIRFLQAHFVPSADLVSKAPSLSAEIADLGDLGEPLRIGPHSVYRVRRLLGSLPLAREQRPEPADAAGVTAAS
jgi:hypothetical protein